MTLRCCDELHIPKGDVQTPQARHKTGVLGSLRCADRWASFLLPQLLSQHMSEQGLEPDAESSNFLPFFDTSDG